MVHTGYHEEDPRTPGSARQEQAQSEYDGSLVLLDHLGERNVRTEALLSTLQSPVYTLMTRQREKGRVATTSRREQRTSRLAHRPWASSQAEIYGIYGRYELHGGYNRYEIEI